MDKTKIAEDVIAMLQPTIAQALRQTKPSERDDLAQHLYLYIIEKIVEDDDVVPNILEWIDE